MTKRKLDADQINKVKELRGQGLSWKNIWLETGIRPEIAKRVRCYKNSITNQQKVFRWSMYPNGV